MTVQVPSDCTELGNVCAPMVTLTVAGVSTVVVPEIVGVLSATNTVAPPVIAIAGGDE